MRTVLAIACCVVLCPGCKSELDLEAYRAELLAVHEELIQAHLDRNPNFITQSMADEYISVREGAIRVLLRAEFEPVYGDYLGSTEFSEYRTLQEPIIGFSKDGSLAWLAAQVTAAGRRQIVDGSDETLEFTAAYLALYERRADGWVQIADAVGFRPPE